MILEVLWHQDDAQAEALATAHISVKDVVRACDASIREVVRLYLEEETDLLARVTKTLDGRIRTVVRETLAVWDAKGKVEAVVRQLVEAHVSKEVADRYEVDVQVQLRRRDGALEEFPYVSAHARTNLAPSTGGGQ